MFVDAKGYNRHCEFVDSEYIDDKWFADFLNNRPLRSTGSTSSCKASVKFDKARSLVDKIEAIIAGSDLERMAHRPN